MLALLRLCKVCLHAADFNRDISDWDVSSVTTMVQMFFFADNFSIDLEEWKEHWVLDTNGQIHR